MLVTVEPSSSQQLFLFFLFYWETLILEKFLSEGAVRIWSFLCDVSQGIFSYVLQTFKYIGTLFFIIIPYH